jgi:hypothetical protein
METATTGSERVWFVIFRREIEEYSAAGYSEHPYLVWLEGRYIPVSITSFNDLDVYEYQSDLSPTVQSNREPSLALGRNVREPH